MSLPRFVSQIFLFDQIWFVLEGEQRRFNPEFGVSLTAHGALPEQLPEIRERCLPANLFVSGRRHIAKIWQTQQLRHLYPPFVFISHSRTKYISQEKVSACTAMSFFMSFARICISLICIDPANVSHCGVHAFDMELVFEADGKSM